MLPASVYRRLGRRRTRRARPLRRRRARRGSASTLGATGRRTLDDLEDDYFDLIVTLSPEAHHAALELTRTLAVEVEYWPTADPTATHGTREQILAAYRDVRDRLTGADIASVSPRRTAGTRRLINALFTKAPTII